MAGGTRAARKSIEKVRRTARGLGAPPAGEDIVVHADPAGAANLMREIVATHAFDVALEERDGHWQVVVRAGADPEATLATLVDLAAECVESGRMEQATVCVGERSHTIHAAGPELAIPAYAA